MIYVLLKNKISSKLWKGVHFDYLGRKLSNDEKEATRELVRATDDLLVYHTGNEKMENFFRGKSIVIDNKVIDTGAAETILSPDVVEEIDLFTELDDFVHSFFGVGGSMHNFFPSRWMVYI